MGYQPRYLYTEAEGNKSLCYSYFNTELLLSQSLNLRNVPLLPNYSPDDIPTRFSILVDTIAYASISRNTRSNKPV